jgi:hypothetical protein
MSLTGPYFTDVFGDIASLDRFFDEAFNSRQLRRNRAGDTFTPR